MTEEKLFNKSKFNISWVSMLVIFIGTIIYPIVFEKVGHNENIHPVVYIKPIQKVSVPNVQLINTLPEESAVKSPVVKSETSVKKTFTRELKMGDKGEDVKRLQQYLNQRGFLIATSGAGSPGHETTLFGAGTKAALIKFQEANSDIILKPFGLTQGTGIMGEATRNLMNS